MTMREWVASNPTAVEADGQESEQQAEAGEEADQLQGELDVPHPEQGAVEAEAEEDEEVEKAEVVQDHLVGRDLLPAGAGGLDQELEPLRVLGVVARDFGLLGLVAVDFDLDVELGEPRVGPLEDDLVFLVSSPRS